MFCLTVIVLGWLHNTFPSFVEWEMSLSYLQNPAAGHHPEIPNQNLAWAKWVQSRSSRYNLVRFILIFFSHTHKSSMLFFRSGFPIQILELFLLPVFCSYLSPHFISIRTSAEQQKLQSRSLGSAGRPKNRRAVPGGGRRSYWPPKCPEQFWLPPSQPLHL